MINNWRLKKTLFPRLGTINTGLAVSQSWKMSFMLFLCPGRSHPFRLSFPTFFPFPFSFPLFINTMKSSSHYFLWSISIVAGVIVSGDSFFFFLNKATCFLCWNEADSLLLISPLWVANSELDSVFRCCPSPFSRNANPLTYKNYLIIVSHQLRLITFNN